MRRLVLVLALAATPAATARPICVRLDDEVAGAKWVLEATVLEHVAASSTTRIRVDLDPARIFRGFEAAGTVVEVRWPASGPQHFQADVRTGRRFLFIVRPDGEVPVVGSPAGAGWTMFAFCDFNAALVLVQGVARDFEAMLSPFVAETWIDEKTGSDPRRLALKIGRLLVAGPGPEPSRTLLDEALADLESDEWSRRERGEAALAGELGLAFRRELADLAASAESIDLRHRLVRLEAALEPWARAAALARELREPGPASWQVLATCLRSGGAELAGAAHEALRAETGRDLPPDPAAWEAFLAGR